MEKEGRLSCVLLKKLSCKAGGEKSRETSTSESILTSAGSWEGLGEEKRRVREIILSLSRGMSFFLAGESSLAWYCH